MRTQSISPFDIAEALGDPPPTEQQAEVIAAPLTPRLVVAGAGSGKTTTMADRVAWLVANGKVQPEEILGVTFTRKAAGELAERIRRKLFKLHAAGMLPDPTAQQTDEEAGAVFAEHLEESTWVPQEPTVSTYHSYANTLVRSYGLRLGIESDTVLMGQTQAWQLARQVVASWDGHLPEKLPAASTLTQGLINLASETSEHLVEPRKVARWAGDFRRQLLSAPPGRRARTLGKAKDVPPRLEALEVIAEMVERFQTAKQIESVLDYGDLLALAATIVEVDPRARATERDRFKVVLLDEFQDTSHAQLKLFSGLFGDGHCVMAVGDPQQSIYGFRGASAGQLFSFVEHFPALVPPASENSASESEPVEPSRTRADTSFLSIAWRNSHAVLDVANRLAAPLRDGPVPGATALTVPGLDASPVAVEGTVRVDRFLTDTQECRAVAESIAQVRAAHEGQPLDQMPTMAVLCRRRVQFEPMRQELQARGVPYEIVGLGGLLHTPEVADVVATLHVLTDPTRSDALARLLAGARWRIGPRDLAALGDWAATLERRHQLATRGGAGSGDSDADTHPDAHADTDVTQQELASDVVDDQPVSTASELVHDVVVEPDAVDAGSLIEALENLPRPDWVSGRGRGISAQGLSRMGVLREDLRYLRSVLGDDLSTVIHEVETTLGLDTELSSRPGVTTAQARRNIDAFYDQAVQFTSSTGTQDVSAFLAWLEVANREEQGLEMPPEEARHDAVQLLTVHASKGLEWDHVYVPGMNQGDFPSERGSSWTGAADKVPWPLRGDAVALPQWAVDDSDVKAVSESYELHLEDVKDHDLQEERRLAYVATTRAKSLLGLSGSVFRGVTKQAKATSTFLDEIRALAEEGHPRITVGQWVEADPQEENPQAETQLSALWPYDPLEGPEVTRLERSLDGEEHLSVIAPPHQGRRADVDLAAQAVINGGFPEAMELTPQDLLSGDHGETLRGWQRQAELLLAQRDEPQDHAVVHMPSHISASALVAMDSDPDAFVMQLRRPMPQRPGMAARAGTAFHTWVENHYGESAIFDLDELPGSDDHVDQALDLPALIETFRKSPWGERQPYQVEMPVETPVAGLTVRGRIDAVFRTDDGGYELVDWKTGAVPRGRDLKQKTGQLALYRLAFARLYGVELSRVSAAFYYVAHDQVMRPHDLADAAELEAIVERMFTRTKVSPATNERDVR